MRRQPRVAIVCDFLTTMGGAEKVVLALHELFPEAPIYTAVYNPQAVPAFQGLDVRTSWLQRLPGFVRRFHKLLPTLAVRAMRQLDLTEYDIIIASTYLHGHQVTKTRPDQRLIAYCHTPPRYYWSHYDEYRRDPGYGRLNWLVRGLMPLLVPRQRRLDLAAAAKVDLYIANSTETQQRIKTYYNRPATVIHPPVATGHFQPAAQRDEHYVTIGRQLPYKRYDLAVAAATQLGIPLIVFGNGPAHDQLVALAGPTVQFRTDRFGDANDQAYQQAISTARGFIYAAEEDFGIVTVEALAAGAPVIGLGRGGTTDIVTDGRTGVLFSEQTVEAVVAAIRQAQQQSFDPADLARAAQRFDQGLFRTKLAKVVRDQWHTCTEANSTHPPTPPQH